MNRFVLIGAIAALPFTLLAGTFLSPQLNWQ